jgi:ribosomal protein L7/L12
MAINDMDCPNCGAPVQFGDGTRAACSFCKSQVYLSSDGVKAESQLNDLLAQPPVARGVDFDHVRQLVNDGKKVDAVKYVREQTDLSLSEAKAAVEAIARGETPNLPQHAAAAHGVSGVDLDEINELLVQGKKIEAIKLYREQTGVGLKEAKDAIEAIEATGWPPLPNPPGRTGTTVTYRPPQQKTSTAGCLLGCLPTLLFMGLCAGFIMLSSHIMFRAFGPLDQALAIINNDPAVVQAFGTPITPGVFVTGEMSSGGSSSSASMSVPISGPKRSGELNVSGSWRRGVWDLSIWVLYDEDGEEQTIFITRQIK